MTPFHKNLNKIIKWYLCGLHNTFPVVGNPKNQELFDGKSLVLLLFTNQLYFSQINFYICLTIFLFFSINNRYLIF